MKKIKITESDLHNIIKESVSRLITEHIHSNELRKWFKQHGGVSQKDLVDPEYKAHQGGLGDVKDDDIVYMQEFNYKSFLDDPKIIAQAEKEVKGQEINPRAYYRTRTREEYIDYLAKREARSRASNLIFNLKKKNNNYYTIYTANDGTILVIGLNTDTFPTRLTWGGLTDKKHGDRYWNNGEQNPYKDDSDTYYYGGGKSPRMSSLNIAHYHGVSNNKQYKYLLAHIEQQKEAYIQAPYKEAIDRAKRSANPKKELKKVEAMKDELLKQGEENYNEWAKQRLDSFRESGKYKFPKAGEQMRKRYK